MNQDKYITSVEDLIVTTESLIQDSSKDILFRGQSCNEPLLPKVARRNPSRNSNKLEKQMLNEFRRRLSRERDVSQMNDWDLIIYAQHYGLATRLLDWTTNPLFALWFACSDYNSNSEGFIFLLFADQSDILDPSIESDPFKIKRTYVVKPNINNERIKAQSGWFTAHRYSQSSKKFIDLHKNNSISGTVLMKGIPAKNKIGILKTLDKLGVNEETVYPGPEGTAKYINWLHRDDL